MMLACGLVLALSLSQATPPIAASRIAGRVMAEGVNTPIAGARIMLLPAGRPAGPMPMGGPSEAVTDANGRFAFERVAPGDYYVHVQKAGFASISDPTDPPPTITVAAGQSLDNVVFRLQKGGAITGRVVDANGEPVAEASIVAMRRLPSPVAADRQLNAPVQGGQRISDIGHLPVPVQGGQLTNDLGEFRVFGLAPGEYFIAATAGGFSPFGGPNVVPVVSTARTRAATTYYPGTTDPNAAGAILITPGAEVGNIVFTLQTVPAFNISGIVVDEAGRPIAHAMVMLMGDPRSGMFGPGGSAQSQDDGRFVIGGVPAGTYQVIASIIMMMGGDPRDPAVAGGIGSGGAGFFASSGGGPTDVPAEVVVADGDVNDVRVVTRRPRPQ